MNYCLPRMALVGLAFALVGLAFAAVAAAEAQVRVQDRMVIVTEAPLSKEQGDLIKTLPRAELLEQFEALGFQKHLETGRTFLFSKKLWAEETLNALTGLYEGLAAHQTGKFLDISKSPQVAAFVRASFGSVMRFESPQSAQFMLGRVGDLLLTDGTRSVLVTMTPEVDDAEAKELSTKPLKQQSGSPPADAADPIAVYQLPLAECISCRLRVSSTRDRSDRMPRTHESGWKTLPSRQKSSRTATPRLTLEPWLPETASSSSRPLASPRTSSLRSRKGCPRNRCRPSCGSLPRITSQATGSDLASRATMPRRRTSARPRCDGAKYRSH